MATKKKEEIIGQILGSANEAAQPLIKKTTETASDYLYSHTIEELIKRLILSLPERRQKALEEWLKER